MSDRYFLDTNIIVYSFEDEDIRKKEIAQDLISDGIEKLHTSISFQVVQEFINVSTRKFKKPLTTSDCQKFVDNVLHPIWHVYPSKELLFSALKITNRWQYAFYDSLIIASAIEASATILFSEDLQDGQTIDSLKIVNPFTTEIRK